MDDTITRGQNLGAKSGFVRLMPIVITLCMPALTVLCHITTFSPSFTPFHGDFTFDYYTTYKLLWLYIGGVLAFIIFLFARFRQHINIKKNIIYFPMIIYSIFVIFSYLFSPIKGESLLKFRYTYEGTLAVLTYMFMLFYTVSFINSVRDVKRIVYAMSGVFLVLGIYGILESFGMASINTERFVKLLIPFWEKNNAFYNQLIYGTELQFANPIQDMVKEITLTFGHTVPVALFSVIIIPIFISLFFYEADVKKYLFFGGLYITFMYLHSHCATFATHIALIITIPIIIIILVYKKMIKRKRLILFCIISLICVFFNIAPLYSELSGNVQQLSDMQNNSPPQEEYKENEQVHFDSFENKGRKLFFSINGTPGYMSFDKIEGIKVHDEYKKRVKLENKGSDGYILDDKKYGGLIIEDVDLEKSSFSLRTQGDSKKWIFAIVNRKMQFYNEEQRNFTNIKSPELWVFGDVPRLFSGRGFIWARELPMLADSKIIGKGVSTFSLTYPQYDYLGSYYAYGNYSMTTPPNAPHCFFLGVAVETGGISSIALLTVFLIFIVQTIGTIVRNKGTCFLSYLNIGIMSTIIGFLVLMSINDAGVVISSVIYILMGLGTAINMMLHKSNKVELAYTINLTKGDY